MLISPMDTLDAVNELLAATGEAPVNSIDNPTNVDVQNALRILNKTNRSLQEQGWWFNQVSDYTLNPDFFTKKIEWISTILKIRGSDGTSYTKRGNYVYDLTNRTDSFSSAIQVDLTFLLDFEDIPSVMRSYITAKASTEFQAKFLGDPSRNEILQKNEMEARAAVMEAEIEEVVPNMLTNTAVAQLLRRS